MRDDVQRLEDVLASAEAIADHLGRGALEDGLAFDAIGVRAGREAAADADCPRQPAATPPAGTTRLRQVGSSYDASVEPP